MSSVLDTLSVLVGDWEGHETGKAGIGVGSRSYGRVVGDRFLEMRNTSTFEPQEANPDGEVHEDLGLFSFDQSLSTIVLREFHSEGFVITYHMQDNENGRLVFLSETVENGPPGLAARLTVTISDDDHFEELFELATDGETFEPFIHNWWTRKGD